MTAAKKAPSDVTVTVDAPFQVAHDGIVYMPGEKVTVPTVLAAEWRKAGWVST